MKKIRLRRISVTEYEFNPDYYPEGTTIEQAAYIDIQNMIDKGIVEEYFEDLILDEVYLHEIIE
jgi:hypothetical protein